MQQPSSSSTTSDVRRPIAIDLTRDKTFWAKLQRIKPGERISNMLQLLASQLLQIGNTKKNQDMRVVHFCDSTVDQIRTQQYDKGWGCGYRNCQMLLSYLQKAQTNGVSFVKHVPNIEGIQYLIDQAWKDGKCEGDEDYALWLLTMVTGIDRSGAAQLEHEIVNTEKWIGATEVYALLTYLGIRCKILDFDSASIPGDDSRVAEFANGLLDCVQDYFVSGTNLSTSTSDNGSNTVHMTNKAPIYIQHEGHSRTIVGIEVINQGEKRNLLVFDPDRKLPESKAAMDERGGRVLISYRLNPHVLGGKQQYQLLFLGDATIDHQNGIRFFNDKNILLTKIDQYSMKNLVSVRAM